MGGLDHDAEKLLRAGRAQQHSAGLRQLLLGGGNGGDDIRVRHDGGLIRDRDVDQHLRQHRHDGRKLLERLAGLRHARHDA